MRISEAAAEIGAPARMLRYYEQQGLIEASRSGNGYRDYFEEQVEHARHVRALVEAGLSTRMIKIVLDIESPAADRPSTAENRASAVELARELRVVENRILCLQKSREAVIGYLQNSAHADLLTASPHLSGADAGERDEAPTDTLRPHSR
ncbi:MerR family transcriptional regulator [Microbacterium sp. LTA6]|uniref:MerR family transcriptional regulator n=1 Tax=unclassified Microbacterium TaxID=2609290 RepID=UPI00313A4960